MKRHALLLTFALALGSVGAVSSGAPTAEPVEAAPGGTPGRPNGGGEEVPDYGDLIIVLRDVHGVPIPSPFLEDGVPDPETGEMVDGGLCWQPIAAADFPDDLTGWDYTGRVVTPTTEVNVDGGWLIPVDQYTCGVEAFFATYTQEVDFGRINQARSPDSVFESQLEDVLIKLATADSASLDPAGRMVAGTCEYSELPDGSWDVTTATSTIDSPLQNLAVYRQLMLTGSISVDLPQGAGVLETAARGLGVASDKGGKVDVDTVAYLNQAMGLDDPATVTYLPKLSETYREEVQGVIQTVEKHFLDYGAFGYDRGTSFGALPSPAYIGAPTDGWFEYLAVVDPTVPSFTIAEGSIMDAVFDYEPGITTGNIGGFAQAADDTRAVVNFMHDWPIPDADVFATPVPVDCPSTPPTVYDVYISDVSGLQVPVRMVDGSEGREFTVTVTNAGPDAATGTVTVWAEARNGGLIEGSPWVYTFPDLQAGASWTPGPEFFTIDLGERTTIDWTATVEADHDVNLSNNTVTAATSVKVTGGGGGGGGGRP